MIVPTTAQTGKNSKVFMSINDGIAVSNFPLSLQATYELNGETLTNQMYLLGETKMINDRPAISTSVTVNGVIDGIDIMPTSNADEIATTAGTIQVNGQPVAVAASLVSITRAATDEAAWVVLCVSNSGTVSAIKGTDTTSSAGKAGLVASFGTGAGEIPFISVDSVLLAVLKLDDVSAVISYSEIDQSYREYSAISFYLYPSIGAVKVSTSLLKCHTGEVARTPLFSGKYIDDSLLAEIGDAKSWSLTPNSTTVAVETLAGGKSQTTISSWSFAFNQLFTNGLALAAIMKRQGYACVKMQLSSGEYFRFSGSLAGGIKADPGSYVEQDISGSCDTPYYSGQ